MNKDGLRKLAAHVDSLLELYMGAAAQIALLRPIMGDADLIAKLSSGKKAAGFKTLRWVLYWNLINELVKITSDTSDSGVPSILSVVNRIRSVATRDLLKAQYVQSHQSSWPIDENTKWATEFDRIYEKILQQTDELKESQSVKGYGTIRDRLLAHYQLSQSGDGYKPINISSLGLKYGEERKVFREIQLLICDLNSIIRNASFTFNQFEESVHADAVAFWESRN